MLTNEQVFYRIINFLKCINPNTALPREIPNYLWEKMEAEGVYKKSIELHEQDRVVKKAYFIVSGYVLLYYYDRGGDRRVFRIYPHGNVVMGNSFLEQQKSSYYIWVCKGTVLKSLDYSLYKIACDTIVGARELALKTVNFYEQEEIKRNDLISMPGKDRVLAFYTAFNDLLPAGSLIKDAYIASYLNMSAKTLRQIRMKLKKDSLLIELTE